MKTVAHYCKNTILPFLSRTSIKVYTTLIKARLREIEWDFVQYASVRNLAVVAFNTWAMACLATTFTIFNSHQVVDGAAHHSQPSMSKLNFSTHSIHKLVLCISSVVKTSTPHITFCFRNQKENRRNIINAI